MINTMIRTDGRTLAHGKELAELPEPCFRVLFQGARSIKTHIVKREYRFVREGLAAEFSELRSPGPEETQSKVLKLLSDGGVIWKRRGIIVLLSPHYLFFKSIQFSPVILSPLLVCIGQLVVHLPGYGRADILSLSLELLFL